jgi:hypothetical protein
MAPLTFKSQNSVLDWLDRVSRQLEKVRMMSGVSNDWG